MNFKGISKKNMLLTLRTIKRKKIKSTTKNSINHQQPPQQKLTNLKIKPNPKVSMTPDNNANKKHVTSTVPGPPPTPAAPANTVISVQSDAPKPGPAPNKGICQMTPLQLMLTNTQENLQQASVKQTSAETTPQKFFNPFFQLCITPPPPSETVKNKQNIQKLSQNNQQIT